ncbi:MAG: hypothetical protein GKR88_11270 [Flavobacteriaceae bacterium]|nr:MAG: hypothetical protein GKR88_11270 [Flavobacteriaceae bacterium]
MGVPKLNRILYVTHKSEVVTHSAIEFFNDGIKTTRIVTANNLSGSSQINIVNIDNNNKEAKIGSFNVKLDVSDLIFGENQNIIIISSKNGFIIVVSLINEDDTWCLNKELTFKEDDYLKKIKLSSDNRYLIGYYSTGIHIWYMPMRKKIKVFNQKYDESKIDLENDKFLILDDNVLKIWNLYNGRLEYKSKGWSAHFIKFIDEEKILSGKNNELTYWRIKYSLDYQIEDWGGKNESLIKNIIHNGAINEIKIFDDDRKILTSSKDGSIKISLKKDFTCFHSFSGFAESIDNLAIFKKDDEYFSLASYQNKNHKENYETSVLNLTRKKKLKTFRGHTSHIKNAIPFKDFQFAITSTNNAIKKWDIVKGNEVLNYKLPPNKLHRGAEIFKVYNFGIDFISGDEIGWLRIWRTSSEYPIVEFKGHDELVASIEINKKGTLMLTGSRDKTIKLWKINFYSDPICTNTFTGHTRTIEKVLFLNYNIAYDVDSKKFKQVSDSSLAPKDSYFISACNDGTIKVWDIEKSDCLMSLEGHIDNPYFRKSIDLILFKNFPKILSYSKDGRIIIWDILIGKEISSLSIGRNISSLSLSEDEKTIAVGEENGQVQILEIINI